MHQPTNSTVHSAKDILAIGEHLSAFLAKFVPHRCRKWYF